MIIRHIKIEATDEKGQTHVLLDTDGLNMNFEHVRNPLPVYEGPKQTGWEPNTPNWVGITWRETT